MTLVVRGRNGGSRDPEVLELEFYFDDDLLTFNNTKIRGISTSKSDCGSTQRGSETVFKRSLEPRVAAFVFPSRALAQPAGRAVDGFVQDLTIPTHLWILAT